MRFIKLDGTTIDSSIPTQSGDWAQLPLDHSEPGIHINERTAATRWQGERCDYGWGVEVLLAQARKARDASAENETESGEKTPAWLKKFRELEAARCAKDVEQPVVDSDEEFATRSSPSIDRWREACAYVTSDSRS